MTKLCELLSYAVSLRQKKRLSVVSYDSGDVLVTGSSFFWHLKCWWFILKQELSLVFEGLAKIVRNDLTGPSIRR